jgi:hypothetical protein
MCFVPVKSATMQAESKLRGVIDERGGSSDAADRKKRALDLWNEVFPVSGTIAAQYLLARGLALPRLC